MKHSIESIEKQCCVSLLNIPIELLIRIVYDDDDGTSMARRMLSVFSSNTTLYKLSQMKGFWSGLSIVALPQYVMSMVLFLKESPEINSLSLEANVDLLILTTDFNTRKIARQARIKHKYTGASAVHELMIPLKKLESLILAKTSPDLLDRFYGVALREDGSYASTLPHNRRYTIDVEKEVTLERSIVRRYLIKYYHLMREAQFVETEASLCEMIFTTAETWIKATELSLTCDLLIDLIDLSIVEVSSEHLLRLKRCVSALHTLKHALKQEILFVRTPNSTTGKVPSYQTHYLPTLESQFKEYFGLSDAETTRHMKKFFIQTATKYIIKGLPQHFSLSLLPISL